ncbi:antibiotic biosynthesis monooxygenase family protein [Roseateles sp. BYS87W]|uniref:Antibiotic biosynthesis monooxygenase family protein n=1 Tax=Pelomonas baiyunensis TaxID=3299026 RepID=A0ABW7GWL0_9BURK
MIVTVFRSRLKDESRTDYFDLAPQMGALAQTMPGYLSHKVFTADDGERVVIVEFEDEASQQAWAVNALHVNAKKQGRANFYAEYNLKVCQLLRESKFKADGS